jgi:hypothetical protein
MSRLVALLLLASCGGSVEADAPECPAPFRTFRYSEPTIDPGGTAATMSVECLTPDGRRALRSAVWCCQ